MATISDGSRAADSPDDRLIRLITACMELQDRGEQVDRDRLLQDNPDIAPRLREYFRDLDSVQQAAEAVKRSIKQNAASLDSVAVASLDQTTDHHLGPDASQPPIPATRIIPELIGRYRLLKPLGVGGMGTVFLVNDPRLKRHVALKLPRFDGPDKEAIHARFLIEAQAAAKLRHTNICRIYDFGEIDTTPYYTMEYIEGTPLSEKCPKHGFERIEDAVEIVRAVADAMSEAHDKGVIHRDLKPANIILDKQRQPVVVDFGLAREVVRSNDSNVTEPGMIVGTVAYMSPEQVSGCTEAVVPASDVWSLGIILHELLTGRQPFQGSQTDVLAQILRDVPRKPSKLRPEVPAELDAICLKMLEKNVAGRFGSMKEVVQALDTFAERHREAIERVSSQPAQLVGLGDLKVQADDSTETRLVSPIKLRQPWSKPRWVAVIAMTLASAGLCFALFTAQAKTRGKAVELRISPAVANDDELSVLVNGTLVQKDASTIRLKPGRYEWTVERGADNVVNRGKFVVGNDTDNAVEVTIRSLRSLAESPRPAKVAQQLALDQTWREIELKGGSFASSFDVAFVHGQTPLSASRMLAIAGPSEIQIYDPYAERIVRTHRVGENDLFHRIAVGANGDIMAILTGRAIEVFDVPAWSRRWTLPIQGDANALALSEDGEVLAVELAPGKISLLDAQSGHELRPPLSVDAATKSMSLSADGQRLALMDGSNGAKVIDTETGSMLFAVQHDSPVCAARFSNDHSLFATADEAGTISAWSIADKTRNFHVSQHAGRVASIEFTSDGRHLVSGSHDKTVRVWNCSDGRQIEQFYCVDKVQSIASSPDGQFFVAFIENSGPRLWTTPIGFSLPDGEAGLLTRAHFKQHIVSDAAFSPSLNLLAVSVHAAPDAVGDAAELRPEILLWNPSNRSISARLPTKIRNVQKLRFSPRGDLLAALSHGGEFEFWRIPDATLAHDFGGVGFGSLGTATTRDFAFLENSDLICVGSKGQQIFSSDDFGLVSSWQENAENLLSVAAVREGVEFVTGSVDGTTLKLWDAALGRKLYEWNAGGPRIQTLSLSADCRTMLIGTIDATEVWGLDAQVSLPLHALLPPPPAKQFVPTGAVSADASIATLAANLPVKGAIYFFDAVTGEIIRTFDGHDSGIAQVKQLGNHPFVVSTAADGSLAIWRQPGKSRNEGAAARWVLSHGGTVRIGDQFGSEREVHSVDELPKEDFFCQSIDLRKTTAPPADEYKTLSSLSRLYELRLVQYPLNDEAVKLIAGMPRLKFLDLSETNIGDAAMPSVVKFTNLKRLGLGSTKITGDALLTLLSLPNLESLDLTATTITDRDMHTLRGFKNLRVIYLDKTQITDKGFEVLQSLKRLQRVSCQQTGVTEQGVRKLEDAVKQVKVYLHPAAPDVNAPSA